MTNCPSSLKKSVLPGSVLLMLAGWFLYTRWIIPNWKIYIHSDHVVPYIMTVEPWLKQDFFYWGAERFGAVYPVFWKVFGRHVLGADPNTFYYTFFGCFFLGTAFLLASVRSWVQALLLVVILLPLSTARIDEFLYPGQAYGTLYLFDGIIAYLVFSRQQFGRWDGILAGFVCALAYWQHLLAGAILLLLVGLKYLNAQQIWSRENIKSAAAFATTFLGCATLIEIARRWARQWDEPIFFKFEHWPEFSENMRDFLGRGFTFHVGPAFGLTLLTFVVLTLLVILRAWPKISKSGYDRWFVSVVLGIGIFCVLFFNAHEHYRANLRHERYFSFIVPLILFALVKLGDLGDTDRWRKFFRSCSYAMLIILASISIHRNFINRYATVFDPSEIGSKMAAVQETEQRVDTFNKAGCHKILDGYWHAYKLVAFGWPQIQASAADHVRNPVYFESIDKSDDVCISPTFYDHRVAPKLATHKCTKVDLDFWHCTRHTQI